MKKLSQALLLSILSIIGFYVVFVIISLLSSFIMMDIQPFWDISDFTGWGKHIWQIARIFSIGCVGASFLTIYTKPSRGHHD